MLELQSEKTKKSAVASVVLILMMLISLFRIFYSDTFFVASENVKRALAAAVSLLSAIGVLFVFDYLPKKVKFWWFAFLGFLLIAYVQHFSGLEYICNTISFLGLLTILPFICISKTVSRICILGFSVFVLLIMIFANRFKEGEETLINLNTNLSGFVLFLFEFIMLAMSQKYRKGVVKRYVFYLIFLIAFIFQVQYASRSSLIATVLMIIYFLFKAFFNRVSRGNIFNLVVFLSFMAILFAYFYSVTLYDIIGKGNLIIFGKDIFTGRQIIWRDAFEQLGGNWFFGLGNRLDSYMNENGTNLHNQMMGYLVTFGILVVIPMVILMGNLLKELKKDNILVVAFILILLVVCFFETSIYSSSTNAFIVLQIGMLNYIGYQYKKGEKLCKK